MRRSNHKPRNGSWPPRVAINKLIYGEMLVLVNVTNWRRPLRQSVFIKRYIRNLVARFLIVYLHSDEAYQFSIDASNEAFPPLAVVSMHKCLSMT